MVLFRDDMAWTSAVRYHREHYLKCSPVVSCSAQHQANWAWGLEMFSLTHIWKHLRPFYFFCSVVVSSHSVPNCLLPSDWNFLTWPNTLNSGKGFGVQNAVLCYAEKCKQAANKVYICMRKRGLRLLKARVASSWYFVPFLWLFCWFLLSFKGFMYAFSICSLWLAVYRKPNLLLFPCYHSFWN